MKNKILKELVPWIKKSKVLLLLILFDFVFIVIHSLHYYGILDHNPYLSIENDLSYAEFYQYAKELFIFLFLIWLFFRSRQKIYLAWSLLFMYLLVDDSMMVHEHLGEYLANYFEIEPHFNMRAVDFGELLVSLFFGVLLFSFIGLAYRCSDSIAKRISNSLVIFILLLVFFGVIVDMLHIIIPYGKGKMGLIEDGGEMIVMSFILAYSLNLLKGNITGHR